MANDYQGPKNEARRFATEHLGELSRELVGWQKAGALVDGRLRELAVLCSIYIGDSDPLGEAERLVTRISLERASEAPAMPPGEPLRYRVTLSESQLELISEACEILCCIEQNQLDVLIGVLGRRCASRGEVILELRENIETLRRNVASLIPARVPGEPPTIGDRYWDLHQVFRHRLAWDRAYRGGLLKPGEPRRWPEMMQNHYDLPRPSSSDPLPCVELE